MLISYTRKSVYLHFPVRNITKDSDQGQKDLPLADIASPGKVQGGRTMGDAQILLSLQTHRGQVCVGTLSHC